MNISDFFGFKLDQRLFVLDHYLNFRDLGRRVDQRPAVRQAVAATGSREHGLTRIVRRREALRLLAPLIRSPMLPWDKYYYLKPVNTATEEDRRYGAEEDFLAFCLVLATGMTWPALQDMHFQPSLRVLRSMEPEERYQTLMDILAEHTAEAERAYRRKLGLGPAGKPSWWKRLWRKITLFRS